MICIKCSSLLTIDEDFLGCVCDSCGGTFINLAKAQGKAPGLRFRNSEGVECQSRCPRDGLPFFEYNIRGVTLEYCQGCAWVWFDRGELEEILRRERPDFNMPTELKLDDPDRVTGLDVIKVVFTSLEILMSLDW